MTARVENDSSLTHVDNENEKISLKTKNTGRNNFPKVPSQSSVDSGQTRVVVE